MRERGQSLLEFALVLPALLILLMGLLDLGRLYFVMVTLEDMAGEGATYAAIHPADVDEIRARAADGSQGVIGVDPSMVSVEYPPTVQPGSPITVTVTYSFTVLTPLVNGMVPGGVLRLSGIATEPIISSE
jgi:Flp pilus assembly protein TadG